MSSSSSSSSMKLLLFMVPLILVGGVISVLGPNSSFMVNPPLLWTFTSSPSSSSASSGDEKQREGLVVMAMDTHAKEENAISDDTAFNHSSAPPLPIQALQTLQLSVRVRPYFLLIFFNPFLNLGFLIYFFKVIDITRKES